MSQCVSTLFVLCVSVAFLAPCTALAEEPPAGRVVDPRSHFEAHVDLRADNVGRIQAHLAEVVETLRRTERPGLAAELRARRARLIDRLDEYWREGIFPVNTTARLTPVFIDDDGRACAVGDLMIHSGAGDIAEEIAACENYAYVPEIENPRAARWIAESGLTVEECAMIQPSYPCPGALNDLTCESAGADVVLAWSIPDPTVFEWIVIYRNGEVIEDNLPPETEAYVDLDVPDGDYLYEVWGWSAFVCFDFEECTVFHNDWEFTRGDVDGDDELNVLVDTLFLLSYAFLGGAIPPCMIAADVNGDGTMQPLVDGVHLLTFGFAGGPPPAAPFPECGPPESIDNMGCGVPPVGCSP